MTSSPNMPFQRTRRGSLRSPRLAAQWLTVRRCAQVPRRASLPSGRDAPKLQRQSSLGDARSIPRPERSACCCGDFRSVATSAGELPGSRPSAALPFR